jgi:hypothetical protein
MAALQSVARLASLGTESNGRLIAAGPINHQPGCVPMRLVLLDNGAEYMVCVETFVGSIKEIEKASNSLPTGQIKSDLSGSNYFKHGELPTAMERFVVRLSDSVDSLRSLYRLDAR